MFTNYRPISVLPGFSKILERLVFNICISFSNNQNIIWKSILRPSKAFYKYGSYEACKQILNAANNNETTAGVFLDLSNASDTIKHDILLDKMAHFGLRVVVLDWFKNYLSNRKQFVDYYNHTSARKTINSGMPQGSILGPLSFIIYVNDIPNSVPDLSFIICRWRKCFYIAPRYCNT